MSELKQAVEYIKQGHKIEARQLLAEIIRAEPDNELAWLWMSAAVDGTDQQSYCLEQVLRINPDNQHALTGLSKLKNLRNPPGNQGGQEAVMKTPAEPGNAMNSKYKPQPIPDISTWAGSFVGWGIWADIADPNESLSDVSPASGLGLLIAETHFAVKRVFGWAALFTALAVVFVILTITITEVSSRVVMGSFGLIFLGAALYRAATWYVNRDLKVRIFREGFSLTKDGGTQVVFWREVEHVRERWHKAVYQGIIHIYTHKIEIQKSNGQKVEMDRRLEKIEEMGRLIQLAAADHLLPGRVEILKNEGTCEFGSFKISRYGITHKEKKFLPWNEVKSLEVYTMGQTTLKIQKTDSGKLAMAWATETGGSVLNLQLFLVLTYWFINAAKQPAVGGAEAPATAAEDQFDGTEYYKLFVTKKEAQQGSRKILYVGPSRYEKRLVVNIPAGIKSGTVHPFSEYGRPDPKSGAAGVLNVEIIVGKGVPLQSRLEQIQIMGGAIVLILAMMWLPFYSTLDLVTNAILAVLAGGLGGWLMSVSRRWAGAVSGAIGGLISFILQSIYYILMYVFFGRESFWNYEMGIVLMVSVLPGVGLYLLLIKKRGKGKA